MPFLLLLSRDRKRRAAAARDRSRLWMLFMRFADIFMLVSPEFAATGDNLHMLGDGEHVSHFFVHWLDLAAPLAIGGLWVWMFFTAAGAAAAAARSATRTCAKSLQSGGGH